MKAHMHEPDRDPTMAGNSAPRLRRLSQLDDYEVADNDPDIRGWRVFDSDGEPVARVHDLVIDLGEMKARYMDLELDEQIGGADADERHVLVPIGTARASADVDAVTLTTTSASQLAALPRYDHSPITRDRECELQGRVLGLDTAAEDTGASFYAQPMYQSTLFWIARPSRTASPRRNAGERDLDAI